MANKDTQRTSAESYRDDRKARLAQSAKKSQKKSEKSKAAAKIVKMVVAIVLAVVVAGGIVWKVLDDTAAIKKNTTVFSLGDDIRVSEVEFTYYYSQYLNNIYSYAQQYAMYGMNIGIDPTKSPDEQNYGTDADGKEMLLSDYLKNETISALQTYKIIYAEAIKAGYKLTDDEQKSIDDQVEELRNTAAENKYSLNAYLKASYGKGINEKFLRKQLEMQNIVSRYQSDTSKKLTDSYSAADIKAVYDKDHSAYNAVDARTLSFAIETLTAKDGETSEQLAARQKAAAAKVKAEAEAALKSCTSEKAFLEQAKKKNSSTENYDAESATALNEAAKSTITSYVSEDAAKWAFDSARKAGDVKLFEVGSDGNVSSYVILYINKGSYAPMASNVRHILISFTDNASSSSEATDEQKKAAKASADKIYKEWQSGAKTEDSFAALAKEKSKDTGSAADGGLISGITSSANYVESFRNWATDSSRKVGDTGIVESEYGYHIMYYSGSDYAWKSAIRSAKASEDFEKQLDELEGSDEYKLNKKDKNIDKAVKDFLKTFKQRLAMNNSTKTKS
jgi:parvulin-like peptidyl-prolyl isomerase